MCLSQPNYFNELLAVELNQTLLVTENDAFRHITDEELKIRHAISKLLVYITTATSLTFALSDIFSLQRKTKPIFLLVPSNNAPNYAHNAKLTLVNNIPINVNSIYIQVQYYVNWIQMIAT